jgi:NAD+ kinase
MADQRSASSTLSAPGGRPGILLLGAARKASVARQAASVRATLEPYVDVVYSDFEAAQPRVDLSELPANFAITLGGDGTILRAANRLGPSQLPVLGVNLGRLGFLADLPLDELAEALPAIVAGHCRFVDHLMFECRVLRKQRQIDCRLGLNETAILGGPPFSMLDIDLCVDAELVTTYSCDGLIVSTPVGSTAHSLSAGGPILRKDLQAFVIQPISPHTLTVRTVIDSADRTYEMSVRSPHRSVAVVVDGVPLQTLRGSDRVVVQRARHSFQMIEVAGHGYYRTLREKLGWGGRILPRAQQADSEDH